MIRIRDMCFSKETKMLLAIALLVPVVLIYVDEPALTWIREFHRANPDIYRLLRAD